MTKAELQVALTLLEQELEVRTSQRDEALKVARQKQLLLDQALLKLAQATGRKGAA